MKRAGAGDQNLFGFDIVGVGDANVHGTNRGAGFIVVKADAFGA